MKLVERIKWIDVAKFLGIFAIYLGHFNKLAGKGRNFVFAYHVALFFFISGCTSNYDKEKNFFKYLWKKIKTILIPFFAFSILAIIILAIKDNYDLNSIKNLFITVIKGNIRNQFFAGSLWFLSCLFIIEIVFKLLKYLKFKWLILLVSLISFYIARTFIFPDSTVMPHWLYNVDSACEYIAYFALGYTLYPGLTALFKLDTRIKKIIFAILGLLTFIYAVALFDGIELIPAMFNDIPVVTLFVPLVRSLILIMLNLIIAKILENVFYFNKIGKETLYLCGNEYVIKTIIPCILQMFSLKLSLSTPLHTYIYTLVLLVISVEFLIPIEKKLVSKVFTRKTNVA